jgi:hypothetical protein
MKANDIFSLWFADPQLFTGLKSSTVFRTRSCSKPYRFLRSLLVSC